MAEITVWTDAMVGVLRQHAWGRSTPSQIAALLGVPERAVLNKGMKLRVRFTATLDVGVRDRIADLAAQGWRPSRIARQVGLDPDLVALHLPPAVTPCRGASPS